MAAAPQEGQGRVHGLGRPLHADSSRRGETAGARVDAGDHGRLEARALLDFFFVPQEEEKEEEEVEENGVSGLASPHPILGAMPDDDALRRLRFVFYAVSTHRSTNRCLAPGACWFTCRAFTR